MIRGVIGPLSLVVIVSWIIALAAMTRCWEGWEVFVWSLRGALLDRGHGRKRWVGRW